MNGLVWLNQIFKKFTLKFNQLLRSATTDQSVAFLLWLCEHFAQFTRCDGEGHKCSQVDAEKYKLIFLFPKIAVFLMYREIYVLCICNHQTANIAYWHLYCVKKIKQHCLKFHAPGQRWIRVESHGMVQPIAAAVLETSQWRIRLGYPVRLCCVFTILMLALLHVHIKTCLFILFVFMVMRWHHCCVTAVYCRFPGRGQPMSPWTAQFGVYYVQGFFLQIVLTKIIYLLLILRQICMIFNRKILTCHWKSHEMFSITCHLLYNSISNVRYWLHHQGIWTLENNKLKLYCIGCVVAPPYRKSEPSDLFKFCYFLTLYIVWSICKVWIRFFVWL